MPPSNGKIFRVFIASPKDVANEREIAALVIEDWNDQNADSQNTYLISYRWDTDAAPDLREPGQEVVNRQLVDRSDILVGIFWQRLGTSTNSAESGTAEEIERVRKSGKRCLIYFSDKGIKPSEINPDEYSRLDNYKRQLRQQGLTGSFQDEEDFKRKLFRDLTQAIQEIIKGKPVPPDSVSPNLEETSGQTTNKYPTNHCRRVSEVLERGSTKKIHTIVDSALYIAYSKYNYKEDLKTKILNHESIPTKYLYCTDEGYNRWLKACRDHNYTFYHNSIENLDSKIKEIINRAVETNQSPEFDFISLGSGNGEKDKIILKEMCNRLSENQKIYYYPIDISDPMIVEAVRNSVKDTGFQNRVDVKAIVGDITVLKPLEFIYEERPCKNFFSILGNTIGNTNEKEIIESINDAMFEGDFVLIEINLDQGSLRSNNTFYKDEISMMSYFVPLESLGVKFDQDQMDPIIASFDNSDSVVSETMTLYVNYKTARIDNEDVKNIRLISVHHYKLECFVREITRRLRVQPIYQSENNNVGLILAQRQQKNSGCKQLLYRS